MDDNLIPTEEELDDDAFLASLDTLLARSPKNRRRRKLPRRRKKPRKSQKRRNFL